MRMRRAISGLIAVAGTLAVMPLGCGAAQEQVAVVHELKSSGGQWTVPEGVINELQTCVKTHVRDLRTYAHEARFYATVTEDGGIQKIKMHSSTLHHSEIESCVTRALTALPIPLSVFPMRASRQVSGGESMPHSREPLGVVNTAGALITLGPIIILAAGVTLGLYVVVATVEETIEVAKRNRKLNKMCMERLHICLDTKPGICNQCFGYCLNYGYWNELACPQSRPN